jgi:hypothetical protein
MKAHIVAIVALGALGGNAASVTAATLSTLTISDGETLIFDFTSLPEVNWVHSPSDTQAPIPEPGSNHATTAAVRVSLSGDLLDEGESAQLRIYENNLEEEPLVDALFPPPTENFGVGIALPLTFWADGQGVFTLAVLGGSIDVSFLQAIYWDEARYPHFRTFVDASAVPLPAALRHRPWCDGPARMAQQAEGKDSRCLTEVCCLRS